MGGYDETATVCKLEEVSHQNSILFAPRLSTSRTMRHECLLLIGHCVYGTLLQQPQMTLGSMPVALELAPLHPKDTGRTHMET